MTRRKGNTVLHDPSLHDRDEGIALVLVTVLVVVLMSMAIVGAGIAGGSLRSASTDRSRLVSVSAAEAGVDSGYAALQATGPTRCGFTGGLDGTTNGGQYTVTVTYQDAAGAAIACDPATGALSATPTTALISSSGGTALAAYAGAPPSLGGRRFESLVRLTPATGNGYALFSNGSLTLGNNFDLYGNGADNADVYVQGSFTCDNSPRVHGSVYVPNGTSSLNNTCTVLGSLYGRDAVTMNNSSRVGVDVHSTNGGLTLSGSVGRNVTLGGTFSGNAGAVGGTIQQNVGGLSPLPSQQMPYVPSDTQPWVDAGFAVKDDGANCAQVKTDVTTLTVPTVIKATCRLAYSNNNAGLTMKTDIALLLPAGMSIDNNFGLSSDTATTRRLWVIVPAGALPQPPGWSPSCSPYGSIDYANKTNFDPSVNLFLYSPCSVTVANNSTFKGQVYGGSLNIANQFDAQFVPLPPMGTSLMGAIPTAYTLDIIYKRETSAG